VLQGWKGRPGRAEVETDRERTVATRRSREAALAMARIDQRREERKVICRWGLGGRKRSFCLT
jgi:hypothetical protein